MENDIRLIEAYLDGDLSGTERRDFEDRLVEDEMFAREYKSQLAARQLIREAGRLELKDSLESFEGEAATVRVIPIWIKRAAPIRCHVNCILRGLLFPSVQSVRIFRGVRQLL